MTGTEPVSATSGDYKDLTVSTDEIAKGLAMIIP